MNKKEEKEILIKIIRHIILYESFCFRVIMKNIHLLSNETKLSLINRYYESKSIYNRLIKYYK